MKSSGHLIDYINNLQERGKLLFLREEAARALKLSDAAIKNSIQRLKQKGKVAYLKKGMYQIISPEYRSLGSLPPEWFIDDLMGHLGVPYYIGLLSAASFHGASHQAPQVFQLVCQSRIPPLTIGKRKICFYKSQDVNAIPIQPLKTPAGYANLSTPEGTAFDLLRYTPQSGHVHHVATVLVELAETMDAKKLAQVSTQLSVRYGQRLGYLLDALGFEGLTPPLHRSLLKRSVRYIPLRSDMDSEGATPNEKWHILINETVEPDI